MPRKYKRRLGSRSYQNYSEDTLQKAVAEVRAKTMNQREASRVYNIPRSTLQLNLKLGAQKKKPGGQTVLSKEEECVIVANILKLSEFGFPIDKLELRMLVKNYLDRKGVAISKFTDNMPGHDWTELFLNRHKELSVRFAANIKNARAAVSVATLNDYFNHLEKEVAGIPPQNIYNFDESNLTDDPGKKKIITKKGTKYPERIIHSSKTSTSIMFCGNATGTILPLYVVYRSTNLYESWIQGGPPNTRYNRTKSGWFDSCIFNDWFENLLLPVLKKQDGPKVIIGDNLSSHINSHVLQLCEENNIRFVCLPANTTHLTQPLDVAYFRPMKIAWRQILEKYKHKYGCVVNKSHFPSLLMQLMNKLKESGKDSLISGFRKCGIYPCDRNQVIDRIPQRDLNELQNNSMVSDAVVDLLERKRFGEGSSEPKLKKTKINITPGKSLQNLPASSEEVADHLPAVNIDLTGVPGTSGGVERTRTKERPTESRGLKSDNRPKKLSISARSKTKGTNSDEEESDVSSGGYTSLSEGEGDDWGRQSSEEAELPNNTQLNSNAYKPGDFVITQYDKKYYPGKVIAVKRNETQVSTMVESGPKAWKWPQREDVLWYKNIEIMEKIQSPAANTSRASFVVPEMLKYKNFVYFK